MIGLFQRGGAGRQPPRWVYATSISRFRQITEQNSAKRRNKNPPNIGIAGLIAYLCNIKQLIIKYIIDITSQ